MAKTFAKAFDEVKAKLNGADISGVNSDFAIQVNMINKDCGGAFYIQVKDSELIVEPYDYKDNDAMVSAMQGDILKLINGKLNPVTAFATGKIVVEGNLDKAMELANIKVKPEPAKKTAVKKSAVAKKADVKTSAKPAAKTTSESKPAAKSAVKKSETKATAKTSTASKAIAKK